MGIGGMGAVYEAVEIALGRTVALKVIHANRIDADSFARFEREAIILSRLAQRHIMMFYRYGLTADGATYIAAEYLPGKSLRSVLNDSTTVNWRRAALICMQICEALAYAHEQGILHRDLKPENIMLVNSPEADFVKVIDFGLGAIKTNSDALGTEFQKLTSTGQLIGSVNYLSPEQCSGKNADHRSDIYSLACVFYEMLVGQPPFTSDNPVGVIYKQANEAPKSITEFANRYEIPEEFELIFKKALAKDPKDRYQSCNEMKEQLGKILDGDFEYTKRRSSRSKSGLFLYLGLAAFVLVSVVGTTVWFSKRQSKPVVLPNNNSHSDFQTMSSKQILQFVLKEKRKTGNSSEFFELLKKALKTNKLSWEDRIQLSFLDLPGNPPASYEERFKLLEAISAKQEHKATPQDVPLMLMWGLTDYLRGLPNQVIPVLKTIIANVEKYGVPRDNPNKVVNFYFSNYCDAKLNLAQLLLQTGKREEGLSVAHQLDDIAHEGVPNSVVKFYLGVGDKERAIRVVSKCDNLRELCQIAETLRGENMLRESNDCLVRVSSAKRYQNEYLNSDEKCKLKSLVDICADLIDLEKGHKDAVHRIIQFARTEMRDFGAIRRQDKAQELILALLMCGRRNDAIEVLKLAQVDLSVPPPKTSKQLYRVLRELLWVPSASAHLQAYWIMFSSALPATERIEVYEQILSEPHIHPRNDRFIVYEAYNLALANELPEEKKLESLRRFANNVHAYIPVTALRVCDLIISDLRKYHLEETSLPPADSKVGTWARAFKAKLLIRLHRRLEAEQLVSQLEKEELAPGQLFELYSLETELNRTAQQDKLELECKNPAILAGLAGALISTGRHDRASRLLNKARTFSLNAADKVSIEIEEAFLLLEEGRSKQALEKLLKVNLDSNTPIEKKIFLASAIEITKFSLKRDKILSSFQ